MHDHTRVARLLSGVLLMLALPALSPQLRATDLRVGSIPLPLSTVQVGDSTGISFEVENTNRLSAENYYIDVTIRRVIGGSVVFSEQVDGQAIEPYSEKFFSTTRGWRPTAAGGYEIRIAISFFDDIDTSNNWAVKAITVVPDTCTEKRPTSPPSGSLLPLGPGGTTITYSTKDPCCWKLRASPAPEPSSELSVSPSGWVELTGSAPVTFTFTAARGDRPYMAKVEWRRCDEEGSRFDYFVLAPPSGETEELTNGSAPNSGNTLDPVNTATGELFMPPAADLRLAGPMPLAFTRYYASGLTRAGGASALGVNWSHGYEWRLFRNADAALVMSDRGRPIRFARNGAAWSLDGASEPGFVLAASGGAFTFIDPTDRLIRTFDSAGMLRSVADGRGAIHTLTYSSTGLLVGVADGLGGALTLVHDTNRRIISVGDGARIVHFGYDNGVLTSATNARGGVHRYAYAPGPIAGLLTSHTMPEGNIPYTQEYDGSGRVARQRDASGFVHAFTYDGASTSVTDPLGAVRTHIHGASRELLEHRDELGRTIRYSYDVSGRPTRVVDRDGDTTSMTYDPTSGLLASIRDPDGAVTSYTYAARTIAGATMYDLTRITYADGLTERYEYDASGRLTALVDRAGKRWSFTHGARGELLSETTPTGGTTTYTYDATGMLATTLDAVGNVTTYTYDRHRRLTSRRNADGSTVDYSYDASDNVVSMRDERSKTWAYAYDAIDRVTSITSPLGAVVRFAYDQSDRVVRHEDAGGGVWRTEYDSLGRAGALVDAEGNRLEYRYDRRGELVGIVDGEGNAWSRSLTPEGALAAATSPSGVTRTMARDAMGRATSISVGGQRQNFTYDVLGRATRISDDAGTETVTAFGARSEPTTIAFSSEVEASYGYDDRGAVTGITDPNGSRWTRTYDAMGRLVGTKDPLDNATAYEYDARNRVDTVRLPEAGSIAIAYDAAGHVVRRIHSDGLALTYDYDDDGRLVAATGLALSYDASGRITASNGIAIERDRLGRITAMTLAPGRRITYAYDRRNLVTEVKDWRGRATTFDYDADGRLVKLSRPNGTESTRRYDSAGLVAAITEGALSSIELTRDASGRVISAVRVLPLRPTASAVDRTMTYDAASQLVSATYDARGRIVSDGARSLTWDMAGRLVGITEAGVGVTMTYDALGGRLTRVTAESEQAYVWNHALGLPSVSIVREAGNDAWYYVHTPDGRLLYGVRADGSVERQYHADELGSTLFLTDASGAITDRYAYSAYGEVTRREGSTANPFTWLGTHCVMQEGSTGLYHVRGRYYDAATGRFVSRDPVSAIDPRSINPYQYAFGNPIAYVDITGLSPEDAAPEAEMTDAEFREQVERDMERWQRDLDYFARRDRERAEDQRGFDKAMRRYSDALDAMEPKNPPPSSQPRPPAPPAPPSGGAPQVPPPPPPAPRPPKTPPTTPTPPTPPSPPAPPAPPAPGVRPAPRGAPGGPGNRGARKWLPKDVIDFLEYFIVF